MLMEEVVYFTVFTIDPSPSFIKRTQILVGFIDLFYFILSKLISWKYMRTSNYVHKMSSEVSAPEGNMSSLWFDTKFFFFWLW